MQVRPRRPAGVTGQRDAIATFHFLARFDQQFTQVHVAGGVRTTVTNSNVVASSTAAFRHDHFTIPYRQHWRALRHGEVNATVRRYAASYRVQTTRVEVGGDAELFRRWETQEAFCQTRTAAVIELTVFRANSVVVFAV